MTTFRVASTARYQDRDTGEWKDGDSRFLTCTAWRQAAENVAESLQRGHRVIVHGRLEQRSYETRNGERRTVDEVDADEVGVSLRTATAMVSKITRSAAPSDGRAPGRQLDVDPWFTPSSGAPPF